MKIRIATKETELEGNVEEKVVTPFGTSAHIPVSKKHTGKYVNVIVPSEPEYTWVLSDTELKKIITACEKIIAKEDGKLEFLKREAVKNIQKPRFKIGSIVHVLDILKSNSEMKDLCRKIKSAYNLN